MFIFITLETFPCMAILPPIMVHALKALTVLIITVNFHLTFQRASDFGSISPQQMANLPPNLPFRSL